MSATEMAQAIVAARKSLTKMDAYPGAEPADLAAALDIQNAIISEYGEPVPAWKIGCTSDEAQAALQTDGPFFGPVIAPRFYADGATVETCPASLRVIEPEIALRLKSDITPRDEPYSVAEVMAAVATVHPSLEVVDRRLPGGLADGVLWHIADCGLNDALVLGEGKAGIPIERLPEIKVEARLNGETVSSGVGANALGGAPNALQWIANTFSKLGRKLEAGQVVTTGLVTGIFAAQPGDEVEAIYEDLGSVSVKLL